VDNKAPTNGTANRITVTILGFLSCFFFCAIVYLWVAGPHQWQVLDIEVSLRNWIKPWWYGTSLWVLMLVLSRSEPPLPAMISAIVRSIGKRTGVDLGSTRSRCMAAGLFLGSFAGALFATHFYYLFPMLGLQVLVAAGIALASAAVHVGFFKIFFSLLGRFFDLDSWRFRALIQALYVVVLSVIITGPLRRWEAFGTERIHIQTAAAALAALAVCWLVLARWRLPARLGYFRRLTAIVAIAAAAVASLLSWRAESGHRHPAQPPRDRVLLITVDTTRADYLSCYGYPGESSPNLDRIAASGAMFSRAFCPKGITDPSHASILTGYYPRTHGLQSNHQAVTGRVSSMAEIFLDQGYVTVAVTSREHVLPTNLNIPGFTDMIGPSLFMQKTSAFEAFRRAANRLYKYRDRDLFMWVHFFDPHSSYEYHRGYSEPFVAEDRGSRDGDKFLKPGKRYSKKQLEYIRSLYAGEIRYMDHWIGKLVELAGTLEPRPQRPPLVLVVGDHGEALGEYQDKPFRFGFGHGAVLYNGGTQVPLIISWPGVIPSGRVIDDIAEVVDVAPTMVEYLLGKTDYPSQGMSLRKVIDGQGPTDQLAVINCSNPAMPYEPFLPLPQWAVVTQGYKLMITEQGEAELYDLRRDWAETEDLAVDRPDKVENLNSRLQDWLKNTPETKPEERELTPAEINTLKALGYIQ